MKVAIFDEPLAKELGKKEGKGGDIEYYYKRHDDFLITFIYPSLYPEKVQPLVQSLSISDSIILFIRKIDFILGELIITLNCMKKEKGFLLIGDTINSNMLSNVIKGTVVENYEKLDSKEEIFDKLTSLDSNDSTSKEGGCIIDLDSMFKVKAIGTVGLGFVTQGSFSRLSNMIAFPTGKEIFIRSIQKHDKDFAEAKCGDRVGVGLKGIEPKDFSRGMILTTDLSFHEGDEMIIDDFEPNTFYKKVLKKGSQLHIQCRLQVASCTVESLTPLKIKTARKIAMRKGEPVTLIDITRDIEKKEPGVVGCGKIKIIS